MEIIHTRNSKELAKSLAKELSFPIFSANVRRFNNDEISVSVPKRFHDVIVVASTVANEDWIELFLLLDALRDSKNLTLCVSYMGYSRQDTQNPNESFGADLFPRLLENMNIFRCIILDNHGEPRIRIPTIHVSPEKAFISDITSKYNSDKIVIVSPDIGGAYRAGSIAKAMGCNFAICNKVRDVFGELKKTDVIGDVKDKICVLVDDIVDSGATLCRAADSLSKHGCDGIVAYCTHGILSKGSVPKLEKSNIAEIILTDSIACPNELSQKFRKLSIASLIAEAIRCIL
ncbi:MAG: ribose-phosphate diphosphokinase [Holosporaceae bacterium]|jgi:ribose-phosphate pyrophosphokinase|nr:ribose-phosphate diphosphokinase [Holosporaceae bacterium]